MCVSVYYVNYKDFHIFSSQFFIPTQFIIEPVTLMGKGFLELRDSIHTNFNDNNTYLSHRIIDIFPRILKRKIIRLKPLFDSLKMPKVRAKKTSFNIMVFFIAIFVENCLYTVPLLLYKF